MENKESEFTSIAAEAAATGESRPPHVTAPAKKGNPLATWAKKTFGSKVPEGERVPVGQKVAYGLGGTTEVMSIWVTNNHFTPMLNIGLGMNPALLGWILVIWRLWDAVCDLFFGNLSDNARTRWGRRRPFIVAGAILTGLFLPLIWWVPQGLSQWQMAAWLIPCGMLLYASYSLWAMPYYSLQLEMSPNYDERIGITAYRVVPQQIWAMCIGWIPALAALSVFGTSYNGGPNLAGGMRTISIVMAVLAIGFGILPGLFVKERYYHAARKQAKERLLPAMKQTLSTRPFLILSVILLCNTIGSGIVSALSFYMNAYVVCRGDIVLATTIQGVTGTLLFLPSLFSVPALTWIATRFGKKALLYLALGFGITGYLSTYIFFNPAHPWWQVIPPLIIAPIGMGTWLILPSMLADVVDYDELACGRRSEGSFTAVFTWIGKMTSTFISGLGGILLVWVGFNVNNGGQQPDEVLRNLRTCYVWIPVVFLSICAIAIYSYGLTRERVAEIRRELEARRGSV